MVACCTRSKVVRNVGSVKASFVCGRALRQTKVVSSAKGSFTISAVAQESERPLWFPGSQPPAHLDGRYVVTFLKEPLLTLSCLDFRE